MKSDRCKDMHSEKRKKKTLNWVAIEENFDDLDVSSGRGGNNPETKEHFEEESSASNSGTT